MTSLFSNKRGVEMSMNLVIVAVIALIILVIIILIVTGVVGKGNRGISECTQQTGGHYGGSLSACTCNENEVRYPIGDSKTQCCCIKSLV